MLRERDSSSHETHRERGLGASPGCDERGHCAGALRRLTPSKPRLGEAQRWVS